MVAIEAGGSTRWVYDELIRNHIKKIIGTATT